MDISMQRFEDDQSFIGMSSFNYMDCGWIGSIPSQLPNELFEYSPEREETPDIPAVDFIMDQPGCYNVLPTNCNTAALGTGMAPPNVPVNNTDLQRALPIAHTNDIPQSGNKCHTSDAMIDLDLNVKSIECRRDSELSDILNSSFNSTDFDIADYVLKGTVPTTDNGGKQSIKEELDVIQDTFPQCEVKMEAQSIKLECPRDQSIEMLETFDESYNTIKIEEHTIKIEEPSIEIEHNIKREEYGVNIEEASRESVCGRKKPLVAKRIVRAGVKKIDLRAQRYIVEHDADKSDDDVDIETVNEEESAPVLHAGSITDLLEQFEAAETNNQQVEVSKRSIKSNSHKEHDQVKLKEVSEVIPKISADVMLKKESKRKSAIMKSNNHLEEDQVKPKKTAKAVPKVVADVLPKKGNKAKSAILSNIFKKPNGKSATLNQQSVAKTLTKTEETNKAALVANLRPKIDASDNWLTKMKEPIKRKQITVIDPLPMKRKKTRVAEPIPMLPPARAFNIQLDHSYCSKNDVKFTQRHKTAPTPALVKQECQEANVNRQPIVENEDGTLMVSLLKVNTTCEKTEAKNRKTLNLDEYKKRRNVADRPKEQSNENQSVSNYVEIEDEHQRMLKHQEKLRKMAEAVLAAAPGNKVSGQECEVPATGNKVSALVNKDSRVANKVIMQGNKVQMPGNKVSVAGNKVNAPESKVFAPERKVFPPNRSEMTQLRPKENLNSEVVVKKVSPPQVPPQLEKKVVVDFGVNTDFQVLKNSNPFGFIQESNQLKPILQNGSNFITKNSLISAVIENVPKALEKIQELQIAKTIPQQIQQKSSDHGENKRVILLEKNRTRCPTRGSAVQTDSCGFKRIPSQLMGPRPACIPNGYKGQESSPYRSHSNSMSPASNCSPATSHSSQRSSASRYSEYSPESSTSYYARSVSSGYSNADSRSPRYGRNEGRDRDHLNAVEERRIIYVGRILAGTTQTDLHKKFRKFGPINKISLHFRDIGENYGFVTFKFKEDAHQAFEHGNDDPAYPRYKISFGGRREFCKAAYSDLDNMRDDTVYFKSQRSNDSFDALLQVEKRRQKYV